MPASVKGFRLALTCVGSGPNPASDDLFSVDINGQKKAHYATRDQVQAMVAQAAEEAMNTARG
jgi:hypothetical protein